MPASPGESVSPQPLGSPFGVLKSRSLCKGPTVSGAQVKARGQLTCPGRAQVGVLSPFLTLPCPPFLPSPPEKLSGLQLHVEEMALTASSRRRKLTVVLEAIDRSLQVEQPPKWSVEGTWVSARNAPLFLRLTGWGLVRSRGHWVPSVDP